MMRLAALSGALWQVRHELERLQFKLDEIRILLDADRPWWLVMVADETGRILDELGRLEQRCADHLGRVSAELELCPDQHATLRTVADRAPAPWGEVLAEHLVALTDLRSSVRAMALAAEATLSTFSLGSTGAAGEDELTEEVLHVAMNGLVAMALYAGGPPTSDLLR